MGFSGSLLLRADKLITISTAVDETSDGKSTTLAYLIINEDDIIAWVKEEEAMMRSS